MGLAVEPPWMGAKPRGAPMRILSLDGGGYLGLATVSFLEGIEAHFGLRCHDCFDFFTGTSTVAVPIAPRACWGRCGGVWEATPSAGRPAGKNRPGNAPGLAPETRGGDKNEDSESKSLTGIAEGRREKWARGAIGAARSSAARTGGALALAPGQAVARSHNGPDCPGW